MYRDALFCVLSVLYILKYNLLAKLANIKKCKMWRLYLAIFTLVNVYVALPDSSVLSDLHGADVVGIFIFVSVNTI